MVRALLDGRKTQTRRLASSPLAKALPDDRLWVRETSMPAIDAGGGDFRYAADYDTAGYRRMADLHKWTPAIHMVRRASRLTQVVTEVRFERLQDISEADAMAEGITSEEVIVGAHCAGGVHTEVTATRYFYDGCAEEGFESAVDAYAALWDHLHGAGSWDKNPELVALTFTVHQVNIDRMPAAEVAA